MRGEWEGRCSGHAFGRFRESDGGSGECAGGQPRRFTLREPIAARMVSRIKREALVYLYFYIFAFGCNVSETGKKRRVTKDAELRNSSLEIGYDLQQNVQMDSLDHDYYVTAPEKRG